MPHMYNWSIKRSGSGLRVSGLYVYGSERKSMHKVQCVSVELIAGEIVATRAVPLSAGDGGTEIRLRTGRAL